MSVSIIGRLPAYLWSIQPIQWTNRGFTIFTLWISEFLNAVRGFGVISIGQTLKMSISVLLTMETGFKSLLRFIVKVLLFWVIGGIVRTAASMIRDPLKRILFLATAAVLLIALWLLLL
ncbi:MAG: hypothetical protein QXF26_02095 [Candidatus Bathyarchaeia archaeon]